MASDFAVELQSMLPRKTKNKKEKFIGEAESALEWSDLDTGLNWYSHNKIFNAAMANQDFEKLISYKRVKQSNLEPETRKILLHRYFRSRLARVEIRTVSIEPKGGGDARVAWEGIFKLVFEV